MGCTTVCGRSVAFACADKVQSGWLGIGHGMSEMIPKQRMLYAMFCRVRRILIQVHSEIVQMLLGVSIQA